MPGLEVLQYGSRRRRLGHVVHRRTASGAQSVSAGTTVGDRREIELEDDVDDAALEALGVRQARGSEDRQHAAVEEQRVRDEPADPELPRPGREPFEQHGPEATALPRVGHHEGDLGLVAAVAQTVEPRDADDLPVVDGDERLAVTWSTWVKRCSS